MQSIQGMEKARIEFAKSLLIKHFKCINQISQLQLEKSELMESIVSNTDSNISLKGLFPSGEYPFAPLICVNPSKPLATETHKADADLLDLDLDFLSAPSASSTEPSNINPAPVNDILAQMNVATSISITNTAVIQPPTIEEDAHINMSQAFLKLKSNMNFTSNQVSYITKQLDS